MSEETRIDPVQYGRLIESVETLNKTVTDLSKQVIAINERMSTGRGVALGLMIAAGGLGAAASKAIEHVLK